MNRVLKYCNELQKEYEVNDVNSAKATAYRHKLLRILRQVEEDVDSRKALLYYWKCAYYNPLQDMRGAHDNVWFAMMINVFKGEIHSQLATDTRHAALYNLFLGDLVRYSANPKEKNSTITLARLHYKKAIEANPDLGQAYNQLALLENSHLSSIRYFILSLSAGNPFRTSLENLKKKLQEKTEPHLLVTVKSLLSWIFIYHGSNIDKIEEELRNIVVESDDPLLLKNLPLALNTLVLVSNIAEEYNNCFLKLSACLCDILMLLLGKVVTYEEEEEVCVSRRRRDQTSDDEDSSSEEEKEDGEKTDDDDSSSTRDVDKKGNVWPLSVSCEWLLIVYANLEKLKEKDVPIPAAFSNALDQFLNRLMEKLNNLIKVLNISIEEEFEETEWLLNGPVLGLGENAARCLRQVSYWAAILSASDLSPVEFVGYFRRKRQGSGKQDVFRKMAELRIKESVKATVDNEWLPLYIVLDYNVLIDHLPTLRKFLKAHMLIAILPSFVLAHLDKMKGTSPNIRAAMRFIEQNQKSDDLRVEKASSHEECCRQLIESAKNTVGQLKTVVSLLVTDIEKNHSLRITGVTVYHIDSFLERWMKTVSNSSSS
ncbi:unnamed protein product [Auanema sp. JU1783]|nr:unnamed protein product [Auanema sp. JU1783]